MKLVSTQLLAAIMLFFCNAIFAQNLTFQPSNPIPGEKVYITYNPIGSAIEKAEKFEAVCYEVSKDGVKASEIYLQQKNHAYSGAISVSKDAKVVFVTVSGGDLKDNNGGDGYSFMVYEKDRKNPPSGTYEIMSESFSKHYRTIGIDRNYKMALGYLQKEASLNPELKNSGEYISNLALYAGKSKNKEIMDECRESVKTLRMYADGEDDIQNISNIHSNLGEREIAKEMNTKILSDYPDGKLAQRNHLNSFYRATTFDEKIELHKTLMEKYGDSEVVKSANDRIAGTMAIEFAKLEDWNNFDKYLSMIESPTRKASYLNSLAWDFSGESLDAKPEHAAKGMELSKQSLAIIENEISTGISKPESSTKNQWKKQMGYSYGMYADTYALCAYHSGEIEEAFEYQSIACNANNFRDGKMAERYCVFLEKVKGSEATEKELQRLMSRGLATEKMKTQYQKAYLANNTLESALEKNMAFLELLSNEKKKKELKKKMTNDKAPDFALVNLKGEKVSLGDLKGKVVVLDFWATWCGPCKASFPGMQNAVNKYGDNDDVVFLFLDTWERVENKQENAQKFIEEKGYTFNVLLDNDNEIVAKYKVGGIPTKFVVDKKGNIRFVSKGFGGNNDELVNELSLMIEMANDASSVDKTMP